MKTVALRLCPGDDLYESLQAAVSAHGVAAGAVLTCVGSLRHARLRLADGKEHREFPGPFEIISLVGTLCADGIHLHIGLADREGRCLGGHLVPGCPINTTAEIVLVDLPGWAFSRQPDAGTGYRELVVSSTSIASR